MAQGDVSKFALLVETLCELIQELETATDGVSTLRFISSPAEGAQLDGLGDIVNEPRLGRSDVDYLTAINARIQMNASCGEPERLIAAVNQLTQSGTVELIQAFPAGVQINFEIVSGYTLPVTLFQSLQRVCAAGVKLFLIGYDDTTPFTFDGSWGWGTGKLAKLYN